MPEHTPTIVIGAGIVGLAVAREIAMRGHEVIVIERHHVPGQETSSRNSGVIHSGIYYPPGSLKASLCVRGGDLLYAYCETKGIAHRRCGKLIVAQEHQQDALVKLQNTGIQNGVTDLSWLGVDEVHALEPAVACAAALFSPSTGIVDVHEYMNALSGDIEAHGGSIACDTELLELDCDSGFTATVRSDADVSVIRCSKVVNAAGLGAPALLQRMHGYPSTCLRHGYYAKGTYFVCQGIKPFTHLVYPMPNEAGLGVHATLDLDGTTRFGPDVEWIDRPAYEVEATRADSFYSAIREYWPGLPNGALRPAYAGVRPKLVGAGSAAADFVIDSQRDHGIPGLVNLLGIESPGLTAALALAELVADELSLSRARRKQAS